MSVCLFDDNVMLFCVRDNKSERARDKRQREIEAKSAKTKADRETPTES